MARTHHEPRPEEIVIEIDQERQIAKFDNFGRESEKKMIVGNGNVYFFPVDHAIRSVFIPWRSGPSYPTAINQLQRIPGQRIHFDPKKNVGTITDGLGEEKNRDVLDKINEVNAGFDPPQPLSEPHKIEEQPLRSSTEQHTWLYWMARAVEDGNAKCIQGKLESSTFYRNKGDVRMPEYHLTPVQSAQNYQPQKETVGAA